MIRIIRYLLVFLLFSASAFSQSQIQYLPGEKAQGNFHYTQQFITENEVFYFGGTGYVNLNWSPGDRPHSPTIIKSDTSGKTYWTFTPSMEVFGDSLFNGHLRGSLNYLKMMADEQKLYALLYNLNAGPNDLMLLALDKQTGNVVWQKELPAEFNKPYNFTLSGGILAVTSDTSYCLVNVNTGVVELTRTIPYYDVMEIDKDGKVFFARADTLECFASPRLDILLWKQAAYPRLNDSDPKIAVLDVNDDDYIYYASRFWNSKPFIGRIRKSNGTVDWAVEPSTSYYPTSVIPSGLLIKEDYVYLTLKTTSTGNAEFYYGLVKIRKADGGLEWNKIEDGTNYWDWGARVKVNINACDVDDAGNIYLTGMQGDFLQGRWIQAKVNPQGRLLYYNLLRNVTTEYGEGGVKVKLLKDKVMTFGMLMDVSGRSAVAVISDTTNNVTPTIKQFRPQYEEPGTVKAMAAFSAGKYAVYSQSGNRAMLQLRNSIDHNIIWTKYLERIHPASVEGTKPELLYCQADRLSIAKNGEIDVTMITYRNSNHQWVNSGEQDSLVFAKFDSLGNQTFTNRFSLRGNLHFKTLQLLPGHKTYSTLVFQSRTFLTWGWDSLKVSYMNLGKYYKMHEPLSEWGVTATPAYGSTHMFLPYIGDSSLFVYSMPWYDGMSTEITGVMLSPGTDQWNGNQYGFEYDLTSRRLDGYNAKVTNLSAIDSLNFLMIARHMLTGRNMVIRYSIKEEKAPWSYTAGSDITLHNASTDQRSTYVMGNTGGNLVVIKLDNITGNQLWEKKVAPPRAGLIYCTMDQQVNSYLQQYTVCGYLKDTTNHLPRQWPFYITFDAAGNIVQRWEEAPHFDGTSHLGSIMVNQLGQTVVAGSYYGKENGRAGVIITLNAAVPPVTNELKTVCPASTVILQAGVTGASYQWQEDAGYGFIDLQESDNVKGTRQTTLQLVSIPASRLNVRYRCLADGKYGPWYMLEPVGQPAVKISGDTLLKGVTDVTLTAIAKYTGDQAGFVWEDSTSLHTWKPIPGATTNTIVYKPSVLQTKLRCRVTSSLPCTQGTSALSPVFRLDVDPVTAIPPAPAESYGISVYPNPVTTTLVIDSLRVNDQWWELEIRQLNGSSVYAAKISNQLRVSVPVNTLAPGMYIVVLRGKKGQAASFRFVKI